MSAQYLNQPNKNTTAINVGSANVYDSLTCGGNCGLNHTTLNGDIFKQSATNQQLTSPTTSIDANFQNNLIINTQTFTTPHSNNNSTSFVVNNYECSGNGKVVRVAIQEYLGSGLPIVTGRCDAGNLYEITIINVHKNQDLNSTFRLSLELVDFI
tara:strand:+ start:81 stop:545 length:465 start_codon:yes stop_codon:yes gene_type:complete